MIYVDDCIILFRTKEEAEIIFIELKDKGYKMNDEGTIDEYLGILFPHNNNGSFRMSQPHLINKIIDSISGMKNTRRATIPAQTGEIPTKDKEG